MSAAGFEAARRALDAGGTVAYPTEAVFGLGCDPANTDAIARLQALKAREAGKGLILIAHDFASVEPWLAPLDAEMRARVEPTWPGPVTWLLPAAAGVSPLLTGEHTTLAVRVTAHPVAATLCRAWGGPLVSTSANPAGGDPARDACAVQALLGDRVDVIIEGAVGELDRPTPIRDARTGEFLRT